MSYGVVVNKSTMELHEKIQKFFTHGLVRPDINLYAPLEEREHLCPFCDKPHEGFFFVENKGLGTLWSLNTDGVDWSTFGMCKPCSSIYNSMSWDDLLSENNSMTARLRAYLTENLLLKPEAWIIYPTCDYTCFFCRKEISTEDWDSSLGSGDILVPVDVDHCGGVVQSCGNCLEKIEYDKKRHYIMVDQCKSCKLEYPITLEEYNNRKLSGNLTRHLCPYCIKRIYTQHTINRWPQTNCKSCGEMRAIDRTYHNFYIGDDTLVKCPDCEIAESYIFFKGFNSPTAFWIGINKKSTTGKFYFEVNQCSDLGKIQHSNLLLTKGEYNKIDEAVIDATEEVVKNYINPLNLNDS